MPGDSTDNFVRGSNSWFPIALSALSVPAKSNKLEQLVDEYWVVLEKASTVEIITAFRNIGQLNAFHDYSDQQLWEAIKAKKEGATGESGKLPDLKLAEWDVFSEPDPERNSPDFKLREVEAPKAYSKFLSRVVLVERFARSSRPNRFYSNRIAGRHGGRTRRRT